ncbi:GAF domain-containing protein [Phycicoccus badiiscoriae]|uniref:GAF domain-containing protein n=1 Tax=Pedococcus badiiscoriae TaxID=642776 RepID=A0A852WNN1_9MICO|nr:GAF and ANTAR domain-containing protein [Pedococcus badiiscoriae]NYG06862.1 GAF domain-containing protein [Pedococcus badiiscoriae]
MPELASVPELPPEIVSDITPDLTPAVTPEIVPEIVPDITPDMSRITDQDAREAEALHDAASNRSLAAAQQLMAELAGSLEGLDDLAPYLDRLVAAVNANIDGCDAVGVTVVMEDRPRTAAYTTAGTLEIDAVQYAVGDGPCLDAFRNGRENLVDFAGGEERWPAFMAGCDVGEVQSLLALPLESGGRRFGALNLYGYARHAFDHSDLVLVRMAAARAADALAAAVQIAGAREVAAQMEQAMASRAVIEQAKGVLMGRHSISEIVAFELLRRQSQEQNLKLRVLAAQIVAEARSSRSEAL